MIWLPYASYPASVVSLRTEELEETHEGLVAIARSFNNPRTQVLDMSHPDVQSLKNWMALYFEHLDSFYTFGLYVCVALRSRGLSDKKHQKTWAKYWQEKRKFRRYINHPEWPEGFHSSIRDRLLQLDWDWYASVFKAEDEPFGEVTIEWPSR